MRLASYWVFNVVLSYVQNNEDAEEVTQDTLISALQGLKRFKSESKLKTWVYSIAINKSKDFLRYKGRQKRSGNVVSIFGRNEDSDKVIHEPVNFIHPGIELESKEQMDLLFAGINQLPEKQKEALILAKLEQMPQKEIAELMGTSLKAVESLLSRAKAGLKAYLDQEGIKI